MKIFRLKTKFYIWFTLITLIPAALLARLVQTGIEQSNIQSIQFLVNLSIIEAPTTIAFIGLLFWLFESFLWRLPPIRQLLKIPFIAGRYEGELESSYDGNKYPIVVEVNQTLLNVKVNLYTERSSSYSIMSGIGTNGAGNNLLAYAYKNTPVTVSTDEDMKSHDGFAVLEIFKDTVVQLRGTYYNNPRDRGRHGVIDCKLISREKKGHY